MNKIQVYICALLFLSALHLHAQNAVFPNPGTLYDGKLHKIELILPEDSLLALLVDSNRWTNHSYPAIFVYDDTDTLYNVGVRMKGNTSRNSKKLSFKIDVDEYIDQTYQGLKTFNLNSSHNDPSVSREFLCAYVMNADSNSCYRANPVQLFLNGQLRGIYSHAEQINKKFLDSRFGTNKGNLYKCSWPAELNWLGSNQQPYKDLINPSPLNEPAYELKTNESENDYSDLVGLIDVINNTPDQQFAAAIDSVFDVQAYLKVLAAEVLLGHWDNYFYNKNNYYLYHVPNGKFVYLPYDMDNTLGVQWGVPDINNRDIYNWGNKQSSQSPLTYKILAVPQFKRDYELYLRELCFGVFAESNMFKQIDSLKAQLEPAVAVDPFFNNTVESDYGYSVQEWEQSYTMAIDAHASFGIKPFISTRLTSALQQLPNTNGLNDLTGAQFLLYPNPASGTWQLNIPNKGQLTVLNSLGQQVLNAQLSVGVNIFELEKGLYFVNVQSENGNSTQKLLIE